MTLAPGVWAALILTPFLIAAGQVLFKMASERLGDGAAGFAALAFDPWFILALVIYAIGTLVWMYVLKSVPLSRAHPMMAMTFVLVPLAAAFFFQEPMTLKYWGGVALILSGMVVINA